MSDKQKFPLKTAIVVAEELAEALRPVTTRVQIAGSIRRGKAQVGDAELLMIPRFEDRIAPGNMFPEPTNMVNVQVNDWLNSGYLGLRVKKDKTVANGDKVKLLRHCESGLPIDFFITDDESWFSSLVCRTGGKSNNESIASKAKAMGFRWMMAGPGFRNLTTDGT